MLQQQRWMQARAESFLSGREWASSVSMMCPFIVFTEADLRIQPLFPVCVQLQPHAQPVLLKLAASLLLALALHCVTLGLKSLCG